MESVLMFYDECSLFQDYIDAHPETIVLDPLPAIRTLLDRCKSYQLIHRIESCMQGRMAAPVKSLTFLNYAA